MDARDKRGLVNNKKENEIIDRFIFLLFHGARGARSFF